MMPLQAQTMDLTRVEKPFVFDGRKAPLRRRSCSRWRQGWPEDLGNLSRSEGQARGTWAFVLEEVDQGTTRLVLRERSGRKPRMRDVICNYLFMERQHFIMERR